jgi:TraG P-loop domain
VGEPGERTADMVLRRKRARAGAPVREAGELLALEELDQTGLAITSDGAFVRVLEVTPRNPLIMADTERAQLGHGFRGVLSKLRPGQTLQFYVETAPVDLASMLERVREQVRHFAGDPPLGAVANGDSRGLARWRLYAALEDSVRRHADHQAAVRTRMFVVVPYLPPLRSMRERLGQLSSGGSLPRGPLQRELGAHRRVVRESLAHANAIGAELSALGLPNRLLNGEEVAELLWRRFNPTRADSGRSRPVQVSGELDAPVERERAQAAAVRLRAAIAQSSLDFKRSRSRAEIEGSAEQVIYVSNIAESTTLGWLLGAMMTRQPYALSVYVHALDRRMERMRLKASYKRVFALNRGAEAKGRVPDFDRYFQEQQAQTALEEMAGHSRANVFRVAIYQSLRAPGPVPDLTALGESVDYCADQIATTADCRVSRGEYQQEELWPATLPLGRDTAARGHKYMTRNVDGSVPLLGTSCGSPSGIPFAFADPGRTLELLDPYDRKHANQTMLIVGQSGKGKTMAANVILGRCVAMGARVFGIDRAGHYGILTRLVPGGREIDIGADDSPWAINPWDAPDPANVGLQKVTFLKSLHGLMMGADGLTVTERAQLDTAIRQVYAWAANRRLKPRESMLRAALLERAETEREADNPELASMLRHLAERLSEFCDEGSYAYLLDRDTNVPADAPVIVFDTRRCPTELLQLVMFMIVEYVREAALAHRDAAHDLTSRPGAPMFAGRSVLVIDEAWHMVSRRETGEYANDLARRARHIGLFLIVISQQMSDFDGEYGRALLRNSTLQLLLAQHPHELPRLKEALDLTDQEAAIVAQLRTVKGQYAQMLWINGERGRAKVSLPVGPLEYWMYTSDPLRDAPAREAAIERHRGDVWAAIYELATDANGSVK